MEGLPYNDREACEEALSQFLLDGEIGKQFREYAACDVPNVMSQDCHSHRKPFVLNALDFFNNFPDMYQLVSNWGGLNDLLYSAARRACSKLGVCREQNIRIRLTRVPGGMFTRSSVSKLRVNDAGKFVRFVGTVTRAGPVKVVQEWRDFKCEQCGHSFRCRASPEAGYEFEVPQECASGQKRSLWDAKAKRPKTVKCHSKSFLALQCAEDCMNDFQEVRVQDHMHAVSAGVVPGSISVMLLGDLANQIQPGDAVSVEGVVWKRWKSLWQGKRLDVELLVEATNVERLASSSPTDGGAGMNVSEFDQFWEQHNSDKWAGRAKIIGAVAPWLSGVPVPKLALLLTLIGGTPKAECHEMDSTRETKWSKFLAVEERQEGREKSDVSSRQSDVQSVEDTIGGENAETHVRATPHLLLLGDPGTGKSQLLQAANELADRSVRTSGLGCSSAGLTCAAVRDGADFVLEAGALVLADGGVCCIDEFSTIRSHDRAAVHEAMEQQTVSVAKAGLLCRLRSQCSVVAAQNCKRGSSQRRGSSYDCNSSVAVNSGLPPPLLSRFDLVVVFAEGSKGAATEQDKADCILNACTHPQTPVNAVAPYPEAVAPLSNQSSWGHEKLKSYIAAARQHRFSDQIDTRADQVICAYFCVLRKRASHVSGSGGVTIRTLQSLLRLAQAHARLMRHTHVQLEDAISVIVLHRAALQDRVVGADMSFDGEDCAPTMRDKEDETHACEIQLQISGIELHHGSDISNQRTYDLYERHVLNSLQLRKRSDGSLIEDVSLPMLSCPTPQQQPMPIMDGASQTAQDVCEKSDMPTQSRGRKLGCRMR